jgi:hypothetical protein
LIHGRRPSRDACGVFAAGPLWFLGFFLPAWQDPSPAEERSGQVEPAKPSKPIEPVEQRQEAEDAPSPRPAAPHAFRPAIRAEDLEAHVRFLAADERGGRSVASPGARECADYIASALSALGLEPAGDAGGFLQAVPIHVAGHETVPALRAWTKQEVAIELEYGRDFELLSGLESTGRLSVARTTDVDAIPEPAKDVALFLDFNSKSRQRYLERTGGKQDFGMLVVAGGPNDGRFRRPPAEQYSLSDVTGGSAVLRVRGELLERLRADELGALELSTRTGRRAVEAFNVIGRIPGAGAPQNGDGDGGEDPDSPAADLRSEAVVLSAHYDHIGIASQPVEGDDVYNGADDNASGCSALLELAERLVRSPSRPARTVIFLFTTGEERGLLGSIHYVQNPSVPLAKTVCNLNFEMLGRPDDLAGGKGRLWLTGYERSNLGAAFAARDLPIAPDPRPEDRYFFRSDNVSFARAGVVAQSFSSYNTHADYHQVSDEAHLLDYQHMETCVRAAYRALRIVADGELTPQWHAGKKPF